MKKRTKFALLAGILAFLWIVAIGWASGLDLTKPGEGLGGIVLFGPLVGAVIFFIVDNNHSG